MPLFGIPCEVNLKKTRPGQPTTSWIRWYEPETFLGGFLKTLELRTRSGSRSWKPTQHVLCASDHHMLHSRHRLSRPGLAGKS